MSRHVCVCQWKQSACCLASQPASQLAWPSLVNGQRSVYTHLSDSTVADNDALDGLHDAVGAGGTADEVIAVAAVSPVSNRAAVLDLVLAQLSARVPTSELLLAEAAQSRRMQRSAILVKGLCIAPSRDKPALCPGKSVGSCVKLGRRVRWCISGCSKWALFARSRQRPSKLLA